MMKLCIRLFKLDKLINNPFCTSEMQIGQFRAKMATHQALTALVPELNLIMLAAKEERSNKMYHRLHSPFLEETEVEFSMIMLNYYIHLWGLYLTEFLQHKLPGLENFFVWISLFGDPRYVYSFYFPLLYGLHPKLAMKMLHGGALGEWINLALKWLFHGDRPYWWVHEQHLDTEVDIQQFHNTCETGPGTPSGHVTIMGIVWYIICDFLAKKARKEKNSNLVFAIWYMYIIIMTLMAISRIYIAAHFAHQCLGGLVCGVLIGKLLSKMALDNISFLYYMLFAGFMFCTVWLILCVNQSLGVDLEWSIELAHKWCINPKWIHIATSLYYTCFRFTGAMVGLGIVSTCDFYKKFSQGPPPPILFQLLLSLAGTQAAYFCTYLLLASSEMIYVVYLSSFMAHVAMIAVVGLVVPYGLTKLFGIR